MWNTRSVEVVNGMFWLLYGIESYLYDEEVGGYMLAMSVIGAVHLCAITDADIGRPFRFICAGVSLLGWSFLAFTNQSVLSHAPFDLISALMAMAMTWVFWMRGFYQVIDEY